MKSHALCKASKGTRNRKPTLKLQQLQQRTLTPLSILKKHKSAWREKDWGARVTLRRDRRVWLTGPALHACDSVGPVRAHAGVMIVSKPTTAEKSFPPATSTFRSCSTASSWAAFLALAQDPASLGDTAASPLPKLNKQASCRY